jgi:flagellar protein FliS
MNLYQTYSQQPASAGLTRIDTILALYDGAIGAIENARTALAADQSDRAFPHLLKAQQFIQGLASGLDLSQEESTVNFLRLFLFAAQCVESRDLEKLKGAERVLKTLREGFQEIRLQALELERTGQIPPIDSRPLVQATA